MHTLITVVHILTCIFIILVVLLQSGKGAEISASLSGSSQSVFGSSGGINFFQKATFGLAALFMMTSVFLTWYGSKLNTSVFDGAAPTATTPMNTAPATNNAATTAPAQNTAAPVTAPATTEKK